jgi:hypothetical protein
MSNTSIQDTTLKGTTSLQGSVSSSNDIAINGVSIGQTSIINGNTRVGLGALGATGFGGYSCTAFGFNSLGKNTSGNTNTAVGAAAMEDLTTGANNTAVGAAALLDIVGGSDNTACGVLAGNVLTSGNDNTLVGRSSGGQISSGSNNVCIGKEAGTAASPVTITTQDNRVCIGNSSITNAHIQVSWTIGSDARDKTNIEPIQKGLEFVEQLNPVSFYYTKSRENNEPNGNKRYGFIAQEVLALEGDNPVIIDNEDPEKLKYNTDAVVPILVNAIKDLSKELKNLKMQLDQAP